MIRRTSKFLVKLFTAAGLIAMASNGNAGTGAVTPALAAGRKALIATIAKTTALPPYSVKAAGTFVSDLVDPHAFTVFARNVKTKELLAKASCKATPTGEIVSFKSIPVKS